MARFGGHTAVVNAIAWHPTQPRFVSVSDDKTIRLMSSMEAPAPNGRIPASAAATNDFGPHSNGIADNDVVRIETHACQ